MSKMINIEAMEDLLHDLMALEPLEKGACVRCGKPNKNGGKGGRCAACLKKLATNKKKVGRYEHYHKLADDALRRQDGKNGTAKKKKKGRGTRKDIISTMKRAEKKAGQVLSPDRKSNDSGYSKGNTRGVPPKLNRGRHKVDPKKLAAWKKKLKKAELTPEEFAMLVAAQHPELPTQADVDLFTSLVKAIFEAESDEGIL